MGGSERVGRNDPCPCGSGRKYKRCCLQETETVDFVWQRMRQAEERVVLGAIKYGVDRYGRELLDEGWAEFTVWTEEEVPEELPPEFETAFLPWFACNWMPDPDEAPPAPREWPGKPLAVEYAEWPRAGLDDFDLRFLREACARPYSFHAVTAVASGRSVGLKDIMTGRECEVLERQASMTLERGAIVLARIVSMDGVSIMCGAAPLIIPPRYHARLLDLRESLGGSPEPLTEEDLHECDIELRETYFEIADELYNPPAPQLQNTDGDPLVPTTLRFELRCTPREAFDALKPLALGHSEEELLDGATFDPGGELRAVRFDWLKEGNARHRSWDTTVLGSIAIDGQRLTAEVNSERRAEQIRGEIDRRLADRAAFREAAVENIEKVWEEYRSRPETAANRRRREERDRLAQLPEVQEQLKAMIAAHWEDWFDEKIPALRDQTPREAAKTAAGRERLEALLQDYEWHAAQASDPLLRPDVGALRRRLGL